jgi:sn-glycerol 3-phosphate transport system ATP-binding protein/multiple sugar transport system ATP-binding protein
VSDASAPLVRIRDLRYSYPGGPEILRIPALDVTGRGLIALTGPSGAGKSTLVELLAGTLQEGYVNRPGFHDCSGFWVTA